MAEMHRPDSVHAKVLQDRVVGDVVEEEKTEEATR
ncbi:hypothetical protein PF005_g5278 [Phytophthora fragariae]|nr:hypothetical protein PF003_g10641 [Phytophthora fragariae]KAE8945813.1 hypothetical protein PF009_g4537 [Phytophthora fragariae]KAE9145599.1 hypothetical protein PF006_g9562 [Phytophthora fragariae]KAE9226048.1 hypothetical protein PF005_g5278 [Phytophthora fragariae]KAE9248202.1 hypothetical protein PF002_g5909 [Phytophthora fragariae]